LIVDDFDGFASGHAHFAHLPRDDRRMEISCRAQSQACRGIHAMNVVSWFITDQYDRRPAAFISTARSGVNAIFPAAAPGPAGSPLPNGVEPASDWVSKIG
jgi:hypothetical protein